MTTSVRPRTSSVITARWLAADESEDAVEQVTPAMHRLRALSWSRYRERWMASADGARYSTWCHRNAARLRVAEALQHDWELAQAADAVAGVEVRPWASSWLVDFAGRPVPAREIKQAIGLLTCSDPWDVEELPRLDAWHLLCPNGIASGSRTGAVAERAATLWR